MDSMGASAQYWAAFFLGLGAVGCFFLNFICGNGVGSLDKS